MKTTQILLHALPAELLSLVSTWLATSDFGAALIWIAPQFKVRQVMSTDAFEACMPENGVPFRICIAASSFEGEAQNLHEFMKINGGIIRCTVDIGPLGDGVLTESSISITTENIAEWKIWSNIVKELKKWTRAGLWAVSGQTGIRKFSPRNRYTPGAAELVKNGVRLLPIAGWNFFEIDTEQAS